MTIRAYPPLPVREDWMPSYLAARGDGNRDFAYSFADGQGAPAADGRRYHSAVDWFAPAHSDIRAPRAGVVTRAVHSDDHTGQVFGGILEIEEMGGRLWVMRHVLPRLPVGASVAAGDGCAGVAPWDDGGTHLHLEVWKSRGGGYRHENMIDPKGIEWTAAVAGEREAIADLYFEEFPARQGGTGPDVVGQADGYAKPALAAAVASTLRARGWLISTIRAETGRTYVLRWAPGTYGARFRFGPFIELADRRVKELERRELTGRTLRPFRGRHRSLYPWPATA